MKIYKIDLPREAPGLLTVALKLAWPVTVMMQHGVPRLWYAHDEAMADRRFLIHCVGTGREADLAALGGYIGSVVDGDYVWHYFLRPEE